MEKKILFFDNPKQCIYVMIFVILIIGGINVFSATFVNKVSYGFLLRYCIFSLAGTAVMLATKYIGYKFFLRPKILITIFCITTVSLMAIQFLGGKISVIPNINGAVRWIKIGSLSVQPSEFSKLLGVLLCASFLGTRLEKGRKLNFTQWPSIKPLVLMVVQAGFILKQPDMGTMSIVMALVFCMYVLAGLSTKKIIMVILTAALGVVAAVLYAPYRFKRFEYWLDPFSDATGHGYQLCQSLIAIGSGGLTGMEWGQGVGKYWYLPEAHTDFAFAIFCQENGFFGAVILILAYSILAMAFIRVCKDVKNPKAFLLSYGIAFLVIGQAAANMCMVTGIFPVIGVPLPFISYGGSSMAVVMISIGLFMSVYDDELYRKKLEDMSPEERREGIQVYRGGWHS